MAFYLRSMLVLFWKTDRFYHCSCSGNPGVLRVEFVWSCASCKFFIHVHVPVLTVSLCFVCCQDVNILWLANSCHVSFAAPKWHGRWAWAESFWSFQHAEASDPHLWAVWAVRFVHPKGSQRCLNFETKVVMVVDIEQHRYEDEVYLDRCFMIFLATACRRAWCLRRNFSAMEDSKLLSVCTVETDEAGGCTLMVAPCGTQLLCKCYRILVHWECQSEHDLFRSRNFWALWTVNHQMVWIWDISWSEREEKGVLCVFPWCLHG